MVRFVLCYAESSLTCKFELKTSILDFGQFDVRKNPIFNNSSCKSQMLRFVLLDLKAA